jgi:regulator of protease activity HflC (stomatin/prohibitin superfamily)
MSDDNTKMWTRLIGLFIVVFIVLSVVIGSFATIPAGHRGILLSWGKVEPRILPEGISFIIPYLNQVVPISVQTQKYSTKADAASKDLQVVTTEVTLNYRLDESEVNSIYQTLGLSYEDKVIQPSIQEVVKASTARYTAEELITKRELVKKDIEDALTLRLSSFKGIMPQMMSITDFDFSPDFNAAIELKVTAEQQALKAQNDLVRIKVEAEQRIAQATAEAQAIKIQAEALMSNPQFVSLEYIKKWDGHLPTTMLAGDVIPLINLGNK